MENKIQESMKEKDLVGAVYKNKGFLVKKHMQDGELVYTLCLFMIRFPFENDGSIAYNWQDIKEKDIKEEDISWRCYKIKSTYKSDERLTVGTIVKAGIDYGVISRQYTDGSFDVELFKKEEDEIHCLATELIIPFESRCLIGVFDDCEKRKGVKRKIPQSPERQAIGLAGVLEEEPIYRKLPARQILFVEDGSVDLDEVKTALQGTGIEVIVYRQGSKMPQLVNLQEEMIKKL